MKAIDVAKTFLGQHEGKNNTFDNSTPLGKAILSQGQQPGQPWCSYFLMYCIKTSDQDDKALDKLVKPSAVETFNTIKAAFPAKYKTIPEPGKTYIVAWQSYKDGKVQWTGHIGLVDPSKTVGTSFQSVEGNAAEVGVTREGIQVAEVSHKADALAYQVNNGLRLLGFIEI